MNNCIIKFRFEFPSIATKEDFLYANIELIINTFGDNFNIKICNSLSNDRYYYLIISSYNNFEDENIKVLINTIKNTYDCCKDITYDINLFNYKNNDYLIGINDNYRVVNGILNPIVEV